MDPLATLLAAYHAIECGDPRGAADFIRAYGAWRANGGFEPDPTDCVIAFPGERAALLGGDILAVDLALRACHLHAQ